MKSTAIFLLLFLVLAGFALADQPEKDAFAQDRAQAKTAFRQLKADYPDLRMYQQNGRTTRLYGVQFGFGSSPEVSADLFRLNSSEAFGAKSEDLQPHSLLKDQRHTQPVMYNKETGEYKFTMVYYSQERDGIPVFRSDLRIMVKNDANYPIVWAGSALRHLGDFNVGSASVDPSSVSRANDAAHADMPILNIFSEPELVIFAGLNDKDIKPRLALVFIGTNDDIDEWLFVADAETGEILYKEDQIIFDVNGTVKGMATEGVASDNCAYERAMPIPYAEITIGATTVYTNVKGSFTRFGGGGDPVEVTSTLDGEYFVTYNYQGAESSESETVTPPGPVYFTHNQLNTDPHVRAQVNAYIQANLVRDMVMVHNPSYPDVSTQSGFPITSNRTDGYCPGNAWYSPSEESINFCSAGSGYPNTSWSSVVHHEFGHHLVNMAGSGQGQYGEGMGDVMSIMMLDDPRLGLGFYGPCDEPLRNAVNSHQYPCSGGIHDCGQLISGCVWDTRNALKLTNPSDYLDILSNLAVNSMLLHSGDLITPQITIDFLTLDDDDGNIDNGTPHYNEICAGFSAHNMDCPELTPVMFTYPDGHPETMQPDLDSIFSVNVVELVVAPIPGTGEMYYSVDGGAYQLGTMVETSPNVYDITLPGTACGSILHWYIQVETDGFGTVTDPKYAPGNHYTVVIATTHLVAFEDDFESDLGWAVSGGSWARGVPTGGGGEYGGPDPSSGIVGANVFGYNLSGDYENSMPERHLTTPVLDCSSMAGTTLKFWRWLGVEQPTYDHAYIRVSNNGTSWTTIWENDVEIEDGSWSEFEFDISSVADGQSTVYVRWTMGTTDVSWQYCGWNIDHVRISAYSCEAGSQIVIQTPDVPDWTASHPLSYQLVATGGSGPLSWSDKNNDLIGTGLALSSDGLLSGTPSSAGTISFTALVDDGARGTAEKVFDFTVNAALIVTTTTLPEWTQGEPYYQMIQSTGGTSPIVWSDKNNDLSGTGLSLSSSTGLLGGTPTSAGPISFIARVDDNVGANDEQSFVIDINPLVVITTTSLPDGVEGEAISEQLVSTGGTGAVGWIDNAGDLVGTGLTLSPAGLLSGSPVAPGTISFTARAEDQAGSNDEKLFSFDVDAAFICGDANADGLVNIFDATFLITFLYSGGPPPVPTDAADINNDGLVNIFDATGLISFLYQGGDAPNCP